MIVKLLTEHHLEFLSLKGGCRGSSESTLVKMSNCWKSRVTAQLLKFACAAIRAVWSVFDGRQRSNIYFGRKTKTLHKLCGCADRSDMSCADPGIFVGGGGGGEGSRSV